MSIYILIEYVEKCLEQGKEPSFDGLKEYKKTGIER